MSALLNDTGTSVVDDLLDGSFDREKFLKGSGALVVGFSLLGTAVAGGARAATTAAGPPNAALIDSWIAVHQDNTATIYMGKIEITGAPTGLLMIAAEELDLAIDQVRHGQWNTNRSPNQGTTAGSNSTSSGGPQIRQAAAEARAVLLGLAAKQLGVPVSQLTVSKGVVSVAGDASKSVSYGALIGGRQFSAPNTGKAPLKKVSDYKLVGKWTPRKDLAGKVAGTHPWVHNLRLPGMLHGRVVRPLGQGPYSVDEVPLKVDESSIKNIKGAQVVRKGNFVGVVAPNEQDAIQAAQQLKVTWKQSPTMPGNGNLWKLFREVGKAERVAENKGSIAAGLAAAKEVREASFAISYQAHASMGPSAGLADVKGDTANVWGASQNMYSSRNLAATQLGIPATNITFHFAEGAGCYGRNLQDDAPLAAALMSQAVGKPVRVQLTRDQEHGWEFYGPATLVDIRGSVDADGNITSYDYVSFQQPWVFSEATAYMSGVAPASLGGFGGADGDNSGQQYAIKNHRVVGRSVPNDSQLPKIAYLRAPAAPQAVFASEQMIDELAHAANMDPVAFRLKNIGEERWAGVLEAAAKAAKWKSRVAASNVGTGRVLKGRGVAIGGFANTFVAVVADITVDKVTGKIRVTHITTAHDCGLVVNPNTVEQQVQGCTVQGISRALLEEVKFSKSRVTSLDWEGYQILRYKDTPDVTVVLVNRPDQRSSGAGEPAIAPVAGAIANAFFDATGKRVRQMPMTPARVRTALRS
jgi:nicotinate dehydrogenase subunit B